MSNRTIKTTKKAMESEPSHEDEIIYFVSEYPFSGAVKIGKTSTNVFNRLLTLQTGNFRKLVIRFMITRPKKYDYEKLFHKLFHSKHLLGEWFSIDEYMLHRINLIVQNKSPFDEINVLCEEFLNYETEIIINEDGLIMGMPEAASGRCGSKKHIKTKIKGVRKTRTKAVDRNGNLRISKNQTNMIIFPRLILKSKNYPKIASAPEISEIKYEELLGGQNITEHDRCMMSKYQLRKFYSWDGNMTEKFVRLYKKERIFQMHSGVAYRKISIENLYERVHTPGYDEGSVSEFVDKHKSVRDLLDHIRSICNSDGDIMKDNTNDCGLNKLRIYMNLCMESRYAMYKDRVTQKDTIKTCQMVNSIISYYGFELICSKISDSRGTRRKYRLSDISSRYFSFNRLDKSKPYINLADA